MIKLEQAVTTGFSNEEEFDRWRERCKRTFHAHREELVRDYAGKLVAIDGERIVEFADHIKDLEKYRRAPGNPYVTISLICPPGTEPLRLSGGRLLDALFRDEEE